MDAVYVLKNTTNHGVHLTEPEGYILPKDYMVYPAVINVAQGYTDEGVFSYEVNRLIKRCVLVYRLIEPLSKDWPNWAIIEWARIREMRVPLRKPHSMARRWGDEVIEYVHEKIPHKDPAIVNIEDKMGIVWLQKIGGKMWSKVLRPGLTELARKNNTAFAYAKKKNFGSESLELKLYFAWGGPFDVRCVDWDATERMVKQQTEYYPPTLADVWKEENRQ